MFDGKKVDKVIYVGLKSEIYFVISGNIIVYIVSWKIINDYGGISQFYSVQIK